MKTTITKYCLVILIIAAGLLPATGVAGLNADPSGLFKPVLMPETDTRKPVSDLVVRQRFVTIRFEFMQTETSPPSELRLNLFDDILVRAVLDNAVTGSSGSYAWIGHTAENKADHIVLVASGRAVSGNIRTDGRYFQIRPFDEVSHLVREIDVSLLALHADLSRSMTSLESEAVELTNQERIINGLHGLRGNDQLAVSSRGHAIDMATNDYFSHDSLDGRAFSDRISAAGYTYASCAENIAAGYADAEAVVNGWMNSPGHRANILNEDFCDIGVGYAYNAAREYKHYWTQNFGRQPNVDTCPAIDDAEGDDADSPDETETDDPEGDDADSSDGTETDDPASLSGSGDGGGGAGCFITTSR